METKGKVKCKICWKEFIKYSTLINKCNECRMKESNNNIKQTNLKHISKKRKKRLWKYSEKDMFREIIIKSQKDWMLTCVISWKKFRIEDAKAWCFAHILAKWMYPQYRLFKNNIWIVFWLEEHEELDKIVSWNKLKIEKDIRDWKIINFNDYKNE